jgi:hypothetical protein
MRHSLIKEHRQQCCLRLMCKVLEVYVSGFYDWLDRPASKRSQEVELAHKRLIRKNSVTEIRETLSWTIFSRSFIELPGCQTTSVVANANVGGIPYSITWSITLLSPTDNE